MRLDGNTCTRLCSVVRVHPGIRPRFECEIRQLSTVEWYLGIGAMPGGSGEQRANYDVCASLRGLRVFHINLFSQPTFGSRPLTITREAYCVGSIPYRAPIAFVAIRCTCRSADGRIATCCTALCLSEVRYQTHPTRDRYQLHPTCSTNPRAYSYRVASPVNLTVRPTI